MVLFSHSQSFLSQSQSWVLSTKTFLSGLTNVLSGKCVADPFTCSSDPALEASFDFSQAPLVLQLQRGLAAQSQLGLSKRPDDSLDVSYDFFAAQEPINPLGAARKELAMLESQAQQLTATIARRKLVDGASCTSDNISNIVAHYQHTLDGLKSRIAELSLLIQDHECHSPLKPIRESEPPMVARESVEKIQPCSPIAESGNKMTLMDYQRILDEPISIESRSSALVTGDKMTFIEHQPILDQPSYIAQKDANLDVSISYDFFAAQEPINPLDAARDELTMLESQAQQLRATIARRERIDGASCTSDNVSDIVAHYQHILDEIQLRIDELNVLKHEHEAHSCAFLTHIQECESQMAATSSLETFQLRSPIAESGDKMTWKDYQRILDEPISVTGSRLNVWL